MKASICAIRKGFSVSGVGVSLHTAFSFWIPTQLCYHDGSDRYCVTSGLKTQHSLYVGAGVSFLP